MYQAREEPLKELDYRPVSERSEGKHIDKPYRLSIDHDLDGTGHIPCLEVSRQGQDPGLVRMLGDLGRMVQGAAIKTLVDRDDGDRGAGRFLVEVAASHVLAAGLLPLRFAVGELQRPVRIPEKQATDTVFSRAEKRLLQPFGGKDAVRSILVQLFGEVLHIFGENLGTPSPRLPEAVSDEDGSLQPQDQGDDQDKPQEQPDEQPSHAPQLLWPTKR